MASVSSPKSSKNFLFILFLSPTTNFYVFFITV
nr:MAG TPA: hypothetical protein [Caudoviricetes sp.]